MDGGPQQGSTEHPGGQRTEDPPRGPKQVQGSRQDPACEPHRDNRGDHPAYQGGQHCGSHLHKDDLVHPTPAQSDAFEAGHQITVGGSLLLRQQARHDGRQHDEGDGRDDGDRWQRDITEDSGGHDIKFPQPVRLRPLVGQSILIGGQPCEQNRRSSASWYSCFRTHGDALDPAQIIRQPDGVCRVGPGGIIGQVPA